MMRHFFLPTVLLAVLPAMMAILAEEPTPPTDLAELKEQLGDRLRKQLPGPTEERRPRQFVLTLRGGLLHHAVAAQLDPTGVRRENATLHAFRLGDRWTRSTLGTPSRRLTQRLDVNGLDLSGLDWDGRRLRGTVTARIGRINRHRDYAEGENMHSMLKAQRRAVTNWSIGGQKRVAPSDWKVEIDANAQPGRRIAEITFHHFAGDQSPQKTPAPDDRSRLDSRSVSALFGRDRRDMHAVVIRDGNEYVLAEGETPAWNRAIHELDPAGLTLTDDRLSGTVDVTLLPDPWVPSRGKNGKRTRQITCTVEATIRDGAIRGRYKATGDQGDYRGELTGSLWQGLTGQYTARGVDGILAGRVEGKMRLAPGSTDRMGSLDVPPFDSPVVDVPAEARTAVDRYRAIHARLLTLRHLPVSESKAFSRAVWMPAPTFDDAKTRSRFVADLARYAQAALDAPAPAVGHVLSDDPHFGPYRPVEPLTDTKLPGSVNTEGAQKWQPLDQWRVLGPIEQPGRRSWYPTVLPAVTPTAGVTWSVPRPKLEQNIRIDRTWKPNRLVDGGLRPHPESWRDHWTHMSGFGGYGKHPASEWFYARQNQNRQHRWYAVRTVRSSRDQTVWLALRARDFARLWVNGRLVWDSGPDHQPASVSVLPVNLRDGDNELLIECGKRRVSYTPQASWEWSSLTVWVCTQGKPRTARQVAADQAALRKRYADADTGAGYFAPGGRDYRSADPPLTWDLDSGQNVAWRCGLQPGSASVVDGDRLFVTLEPHTLVCLNAATGKELWRRSCDVLSETGEKTSRTLEGLRAALARLRELDHQYEQARRALRRDRKARRKSDKLTDARRKELQQTAEKNKAEMEKVRTEWDPFRKKLQKLGIAVDDASLGRRAGAVPVVRDGRVYVSFGTGAAACFTADGKKVWQKATGLPWTGGNAYSPVLCGDRLIVPGTLATREGDKRERPNAFVALRASDGKHLWTSEPIAPPGSPGVPGVAPVKLFGHDGNSAFALVTPEGTVLDARDGGILRRRLFELGGPVTPMVWANVVYLAGKNLGQAALELWLDEAGRIGCRRKWEIRRAGTSSRQHAREGLVLEGRMYLPRVSDESGGHHPVAWDQLDVYETALGQHLSRPNPVVFTSSSPLPLVRAGEYLVYSDAGLVGHTEKPKACVTYMTLGDTPLVLHMQIIPSAKLRAAPVFAGPRAYLVTNEGLICVGSGSKEARRRDLEALARRAIAEIGRKPDYKVKTIEPVELEVDDRTPIWPAQAHMPPNRWLVAGPFRSSPRLRLPDPNAIGSLKPQPGQKLRAGTKSDTFRPLVGEALVMRSMTKIFRSDGTSYKPTRGVDIGKLTDRKDYTATFLYTVLEVPQEQTWNLRLYEATGWLAGEPVGRENAVRLKPGYYPLLLRMEMGLFPPIGQVTLAPMLNPILSPQKACRDWLERIARRESLLRTVQKEIPGSRYGWYAEKFLSALKEARAAN